MKIGRHNHHCVTLQNGKVMVANGASDSGTTILNSVEIYDPLRNVWTDGIPTPQAGGNGQMVLVNGSPTIVGGTWTTSTGSVLSDRLLILQGSNWIESDVKMKITRTIHFATMIPISMLPNCRKLN